MSTTQVSHQSELVLEFNGHEIYEFPYSRANFQALWKKTRRYKNLFNVEIRDDFEKFIGLFIEQHGDPLDYVLSPRGIVWVIDDLDGMLYLTNIYPDNEATCHVALFNKKLRDPLLTKEMIKYVFRTFRFRRLNAEVPVYSLSWFFDFVKALGFIEEGNKRRAVLFDNKYFDLRLYGLLATESLGSEAIDLGIV